MKMREYTFWFDDDKRETVFASSYQLAVKTVLVERTKQNLPGNITGCTQRPIKQ